MKEVSEMVTKKIGGYIKEKGISITRISEATGISYQILTNCFDEKKSRELKADELLLVCRFLEINPFNFMDAAQEREDRKPTRYGRRNGKVKNE